MTQMDIARVALGAPALQQVLVVSRPECLLIKSWARNERSNTEDAAALIGNLFRDCDDALAAVGGRSDPRTLMVEASDRVVVVSRVAEDMSAAFVFEPTAPLGLIRVQARQLTAQLARTLAGTPARLPAPTGPATAPNAPNAGPRSSPAAASERSPGFGIPSVRPPPTSDLEEPAPPKSPAFGVPSIRPPASAARAAEGLTPHPTIADRSPAHGIPAVPPNRSTAIPVPEPKPVAPLGLNPNSSIRPDASGRFEQLRTRITTFAQQAPDARSALLRLSLRTGLPMELLERVSSLSPAQADLVSRALDEMQKKTTS